MLNHLYDSLSQAVNIGLMHKHVAHLHVDGIYERLLKQQGLELTRMLFPPYDTCSLAKSSRIVCKTQHTRVTSPFRRVHINLCEKSLHLGLAIATTSCCSMMTSPVTVGLYFSPTCKGQAFDIIQ